MSLSGKKLPGKTLRRAATAALTSLVILSQPAIATAAEIKVAAGAGIRAVLEALAPEFERSTGHKLVIRYGSGGDVRTWVNSENPDVAIVVRPVFDDLVKQGKIESASAVNIARTFIGIAVRTDTPKPEIGSVDAVNRLLLSAKTIAYPDPASGSASAAHFIKVLDRLGLTEAVRSKTKLVPGPNIAAKLPVLVAQGEAEIAVSQLSELMPHSKIGIEIVGPMPPELQDVGAFTIAAGIVREAREPEAGQALIKFISAPSVSVILKAKGMEPG